MDKQYFKGFLLGVFVAFLMSMAVVGIVVLKQNNNTPSCDDETEKFSTILRYLDSYYIDDYDVDELFQKAYAGFVSGLGDVYSVYYTEDEYKSFSEQTSGVFIGIGSYVSIDEATGYPCLTQPIKGGPAEKAGIKAGDLLIEINGENCHNMDLDIATSKIKGKKGTEVTLTIARDGEKEYLKYTIKRDEVTTISVENQMFDDKIGYVRVTNFAEKTAEQFSSAIDEMMDEGMESLIIDLRSNPGGYLNVAIDMCDKILPAGKLVTYTKDKKERKVEYKTSKKSELNIPIVVLVDKNSASASEVFTGCLRDYDKITIIGEQTFGKGIVQTIYFLPDNSALKLTSSYYYSPNGINIHGTGIEPDINVVDDLQTEVDEVVEKAKEYLKK